MASVFIMGLSDSYTREKLFQQQPDAGKTTVQFDVLVAAASAIQQAKDNCQDSGSATVYKYTGQEEGGKKIPKCFHCNKTSHSDKGFTKEVRELHCKAARHKCKICEKVGHFPDACRKGQSFGQKTPKKARVNVVTAEEKAGEASVVTQLADAAAEPSAQAAALNSIEQVRPYRFNPERYEGYQEDGHWWSLEALEPKPIQTTRPWARMEAISSGPVLGHYLFDNDRQVWRSAAPPSHAAKHVRVELDRSSYSMTGMRKP